MSKINPNMAKSQLPPSINKMLSSEVSLNAEILRIQAYTCMKEVERIWDLNESEICDFFQKYTSLPMSRIRT